MEEQAGARRPATPEGRWTAGLRAVQAAIAARGEG
jgi:hypothetical protein